MLAFTARRVPATLAGRATLMRTYTSGSEGSVAQSKEFGKKERAHEEQYARRHDAELLRKLKAQIEKKKKEISADERLQAELESKVKDTETQ